MAVLDDKDQEDFQRIAGKLLAALEGPLEPWAEPEAKGTKKVPGRRA